MLLMIIFVLVACQDSTTKEGAEWLREPDLDIIQNAQFVEIPVSDIYEVTASKAAFALMELEQTRFTKLSPQQALWYTGPYYDSSPDKQAYLVRAVYGHAGTGAFSLKRLEDDLLIVHQSLGRSTIYQKTALVVNLDFEPGQIYIDVKIAE